MVNDYLAVVNGAAYAHKPAKRFALAAIAITQRPERGCFLSNATLARRVGVSLATIKRYLKQATDDGFLCVKYFRNAGGHKCAERWVVTESLGSLGEPRDDGTLGSNSDGLGSKSKIPRLKIEKPTAHPDEPRVVKTMSDKSMSEGIQSDGTTLNSARKIKTITVEGQLYTAEDWPAFAQKRIDFQSRVTHLTFDDGSSDLGLIRWDDTEWRNVVRSRLGERLI